MTLDRTGEELDWPDIPAHDPRCDGHGWIDAQADHPVPCYDCRPHLRPAELRRRTFGPESETNRA